MGWEDKEKNGLTEQKCIPVSISLPKNIAEQTDKRTTNMNRSMLVQRLLKKYLKGEVKV